MHDILTHTSMPRAEVASGEFIDRGDVATISALGAPGERHFVLRSGGQERRLREAAADRCLDSGSVLLDGLFALALQEVRENSVSSINDHSFRNGQPLTIEAFETGEQWHYVWTRDLAYAIDLALAGIDAPRCMTSLLYKTSCLKVGLGCSDEEQILQDTGSGGSYPVSTDRVVWALAAGRLLHHLPDAERATWRGRVLPILRNTIEQDRRLIFDAATGLYRGEQSFLDWREQTYPLRTRDNVLEVAMSQSLSTNVLHFVILQTAAEWSRQSGDPATAERYHGWAQALKRAINDRLFDEAAGLYAAYLLTDLAEPVRVHRYELLGQALAILSGVADPDRAQRLLQSYPTGPHGPSVVWPQEATVPIYHNHAIWPFVTAYWAKAARAVGHEPALAAAVHSLVRGAALNLSNMENLDWASGCKHATAHGLEGPVINSRRQLWSVAGFVSVVQDGLIGMETSESGIRFVPCLPARTRQALLEGSRRLSLRRIEYRGKRIHVEVIWPEEAGGQRLGIGSIWLNGRAISDDFVPCEQLLPENDWIIELTPLGAVADEPVLPLFDDFGNARAVFAPPVPTWREQAIALEGALLRLNFSAAGPADVQVNIYRDGRCVARGVTADRWIDPQSADLDTRASRYVLEAVDPASGHHSYPSDSRSLQPPVECLLPTPALPCDCGQEAVVPVEVPAPGRYAVQLLYANGNGRIFTGITCAVKRVRVLSQDGGEIAEDHVVLPQTGSHDIVQAASPLCAVFPAAGRYELHVDEDDVCRNMSCLAHNENYTGYEGGGPHPCNNVSLHGVRLHRMPNAPSHPASVSA
jgi:hypothetical protein